MSPEERYREIALKIVPRRHDQSRTDLRDGIVKALKSEVESALEAQRSEKFPEIAELHAALRRRESAVHDAELEVKKKQAAAETAFRQKQQAAESAFSQRELAVALRENRMKAFLKAFDAYVDWLDGKGEVDENGKLFNDLLIACRAFKGAK